MQQKKETITFSKNRKVRVPVFEIVQVQPNSISISGGPGVAPSPSTIIISGYGLKLVTSATITYPTATTGVNTLPFPVIITQPEQLLESIINGGFNISSGILNSFDSEKRDRCEKKDKKKKKEENCLEQLILTLPPTPTVPPLATAGIATITFFFGFNILGSVSLTVTA
jgi:hypothetical protein